MKILLLGGTGAIGSYLADILSAENRVEKIVITTRNKKIIGGGKISYAIGNAKDYLFLQEQCRQYEWDAIVDFMSYKTEEFANRVKLLLSSTKQYIFISSARVYGNEEHPIRESSPLLLNSSQDKIFLQTDEYSLTKARQEKILSESGANYTIIRPYITYGNYRLQLGVMEKEEWLFRALHNRTIVFPEEVFDKHTTMSNGYDVAYAISQLIACPSSMSQVFHIASEENMTWIDIFNIYKECIKDKTGLDLKIKLVSTDDFIKCRSKSLIYQLIYDRMYDRDFDTSKLRDTINVSKFVSPYHGIRQCMNQFLDFPKWNNPNVISEASKDKLVNEYTPLSQISGMKNRIKYLLKRFIL